MEVQDAVIINTDENKGIFLFKEFQRTLETKYPDKAQEIMSKFHRFNAVNSAMNEDDSKTHNLVFISIIQAQMCLIGNFKLMSAVPVNDMIAVNKEMPNEVRSYLDEFMSLLSDTFIKHNLPVTDF